MNPSELVIIRHLAMTRPDQLRASAGAPPSGVRMVLVEQDRGATARDCYHRVGAGWNWNDRQSWDVDEWQQLLEEERGELWVVRDGGALAGYAQLARRGDDVEIHYFGLTPEYIGRGIGGWFLTRIVERCWGMGANRVTLNTCTLDGPGAFPNYLARGFEVVREETRPREANDGSL